MVRPAPESDALTPYETRPRSWTAQDARLRYSRGATQFFGSDSSNSIENSRPSQDIEEARPLPPLSHLWFRNGRRIAPLGRTSGRMWYPPETSSSASTSNSRSAGMAFDLLLEDSDSDSSTDDDHLRVRPGRIEREGSEEDFLNADALNELLAEDVDVSTPVDPPRSYFEDTEDGMQTVIPAGAAAVTRRWAYFSEDAVPASDRPTYPAARYSTGWNVTPTSLSRYSLDANGNWLPQSLRRFSSLRERLQLENLDANGVPRPRGNITGAGVGGPTIGMKRKREDEVPWWEVGR
ncbi:hypothetical protein M427DRAFT_30660 [Gonapodya prolifera JEL478]|uniref:Uncharacterized protein n=1 Tax=Gonapodya prolifera (strain JEL478) TaxID=1344416 RepID=A0A139AK97_GONPJ|nr:hypothetical protein M427DRAFT_30660 [Gonapodya prolifera JEL478]|eukprot:KXS17197.1 hypothetical protein M427DRAFT_30660 [Gonapodya prolifera JEL478]